ncbi:MAG: molybdenum cofactor guanylyltransferase, partial [Acidimicrobiales bacterium]
MAGTCFGILLTGGASTRMGRDKSSLEVGGISLARRSAEVLATSTDVAIEVGPGHSGLPSVTES